MVRSLLWRHLCELFLRIAGLAVLDRFYLADESSDLAADRPDLAADRPDLAAESSDLAADCSDLAADCSDLAAECSDLAADRSCHALPVQDLRDRCGRS